VGLSGAPAAVVLGSLAAPEDPALDDLLGTVAVAALRRELVRRACRWAATVAPGLAFEATTPGAALAALAEHEGPVLLVAPDVPALDARLAEAALADLAGGAAMTFGPATDGSFFLVGLPRADDAMVEAVEGGFDAATARARAEGSELAMLRSERRLVSPADARALAADPRAPLELSVLLSAGLPVRSRAR
jgi:hypothetical protein